MEFSKTSHSSAFEAYRKSIGNLQWNDWKWQQANRITTATELARFIEISPQEFKAIGGAGERFRFAITPYYASLMDPENPDCPVRLQAVPKMGETVSLVLNFKHAGRVDVSAPVKESSMKRMKHKGHGDHGGSMKHDHNNG